MVPYIYGKLVRPTTMRTLQVRLRDTAQSAPGKTSSSAGIPANASGWLAGDNFLITENDKSVLVLNIEAGRPSMLLEIPRVEIAWMAIPGLDDVLVKLIDAQPSVKVIRE
jgi:hypothetical protein